MSDDGSIIVFDEFCKVDLESLHYKRTWFYI